jgi:O-antigen/teichoic acid export membrane protein
MRSTTTQLFYNALYGAGARVVSVAVAILMTPYLVSRLGMERFGIWALIAGVTGAMGFLDFSFKGSFTKHLAEAMARKERRNVDAIISTGLVFYLLFAVATGAALLLALEPILDLMNVQGHLRPEARLVLLINVFRFLSIQVFSVFGSVCDARQRLDLTNSLGVGTLLIGTALSVWWIEWGWGLAGLAWAQLAAVWLFHLGLIPLAWRLADGFSIGPRHVTLDCIKRLFPFGLKLHVSAACGMVNSQLDKFLLTHRSGLAYVGSYELASRAAANIGTFPAFLAVGLLPLSSHLAAQGRQSELVAVYEKTTRYLCVVGIPLFVFLGVYARDLMTAWLGHPDPSATAMLTILSAGWLFSSLSHGMAFVCQGVGRPGMQTVQSALQLVANVVLSVTLMWLIGPLGAPLGTSLALMFGAAYFAVVFHRHMGVDLRTFLRRVALVPTLAAAVAALPAVAIMRHAPATRWEALPHVAAGAAAFAVALGFVIIRWKFIPPPVAVWLAAWRSSRSCEGPTP